MKEERSEDIFNHSPRPHTPSGRVFVVRTAVLPSEDGVEGFRGETTFEVGRPVGGDGLEGTVLVQLVIRVAVLEYPQVQEVVRRVVVRRGGVGLPVAVIFDHGGAEHVGIGVPAVVVPDVEVRVVAFGTGREELGAAVAVEVAGLRRGHGSAVVDAGEHHDRELLDVAVEHDLVRGSGVGGNRVGGDGDSGAGLGLDDDVGELDGRGGAGEEEGEHGDLRGGERNSVDGRHKGRVRRTGRKIKNCVLIARHGLL